MSSITLQLQRMTRPDKRDRSSPTRMETSEHGSAGAPGETRVRETRHDLAFRDELARKGLHVLALVIPLGVWPVGRTFAVVVCGAAAAAALAADVLRVRSPRFAAVIDRCFGFMMRLEECPPVGGPIVLNGATWVLLSATLLAAVLPMEVAIVSFTVFMVADAAAAIVGRSIGRRRWPRSIRTVEGSIAFFVTGTAVMLLFGSVPLWTVAIAVLAGTAAEIPSRPLNDNVRVPFVMGIVIYFCGLPAV